MARSKPPRPPAQQPGRALRAVALTAVIAGVLVLAAAAFALSYSGIHAIARQSGISAPLARGYPVIVDAMLVIAGAAVLALRGAGWLSKFYAWLVLLVLLAAVAGADALHSTNTAIPHRAAAAAAVVLPWFLLLIGFGLLLAMLRHFRLHRAGGVTAPAQVPHASPLPNVPPQQAQLPAGPTGAPIAALPAGPPQGRREPGQVGAPGGRPRAMPAGAPAGLATPDNPAPAPAPAAGGGAAGGRPAPASPGAPVTGASPATAPAGGSGRGAADGGTSLDGGGTTMTAGEQTGAGGSDGSGREPGLAGAGQPGSVQPGSARPGTGAGESGPQATPTGPPGPAAAGAAGQGASQGDAAAPGSRADARGASSAGPDAAYLDDDELDVPEEIFAAPAAEENEAGPDPAEMPASSPEPGSAAGPQPAFHRMWSSPTPPGDEDQA